MSNEKKCNNCGFSNTPGSKFCNNCGNKLPLSTHIICPNCQTNNSIDRIFCDNCGTRLIQDDPLPEQPQPEESPKSGNKGFSLPTRRPGNTGHLDPNVLPEWLKTGKTGDLDPSEEDEAQGLPDIDIGDAKPLHKLEELTADKSLTDDLPDWLVRSNDSDPIIAEPDGISTELYLDLVDQSDNFDEDNLPFDASDANLPDWLSGSFKKDTSILPSESDTGKLPPIPEEDAVESESSGLTELFSGMDSDFTTEPDSASSESDISGLTALFSDLQDDESETAESDDVTESSSGLTDWLSELSQSDAAIQDTPSNDLGAEESEWLHNIEEESASEPDSLTSWLQLPEEQAEEASSAPIVPDGDNLADEIVENLAAEQADISRDFAELFTADDDSSDSNDLPDWMANIEAADESLIASDGETLDDSLFSLEGNAAQSELDWLMQTGELSMPDEPSGLDIPSELELPAGEPGGQSLDEDAGDLDWLSDLTLLDTGSLQQDDEAVFEEIVQPDEPTQPDGLDDNEIVDDDGDWQNFKGLLAAADPEEPLDVELSLDAQVSEWLDSAPTDLELDETPLIPSGEQVVSDDPFPLPGNSVEGETPTPAKGFTDWLEYSDELEEAQLEAQAETSDSDDSFGEWDGLLSELKPDDSVPDAAQSELPDWISDLNLDERVEPLELTTTVDETAPVETEGPLAGLRDIIGVAPVVTLIQDEAVASQFTVTPEQRQQLELLRQLAHDGAKSDAAKAVATQSDASVTRIFLAVLLLAAMLVGFLLPDVLPARLLPEQPTTVSALTAVDAAAGETVLVAFEYTPALAGELAPQSQLLLNHLAQNGSRIVAISQHAAGVALAASALEEHGGDLIGYLPGEAVGLRQLSDCLNQEADACAMSSNWIGRDGNQIALSDVSMVLVFTGQRDSLVHWVEQVGMTTDIPIVAGITQALEPVAAPYYASGQLTGVIAGAPATAVYSSLIANESSDNESTQLSVQLLSQAMGQIIIVAIFIAGLFIYGIIYPLANRRKKS